MSIAIRLLALLRIFYISDVAYTAMFHQTKCPTNLLKLSFYSIMKSLQVPENISMMLNVLSRSHH